jgi:hypothetical protein
MRTNNLKQDSSWKWENSENQKPDILSNLTGNPQASSVLVLIENIRDSILKLDKTKLWENLKELSDIFRPQSHETSIKQHNGRITTLLWSLRNASLNNWNKPMKVMGVLKNTQKVSIESRETIIIPSVELVMEKPMSHNWRFCHVPTDPCMEREIMLLKIYWISSDKISDILG